MATDIHWTRSIGTRIVAIVVLLLAVAGGMVVLNLAMMSAVEGDAARAVLQTEGRAHSLSLLDDAHQLATDSPTERGATVARIRITLQAMERRFTGLRDGDPARDVEPPDDAAMRTDLQAREDYWRTKIVPQVERVLATTTPQEVLPLIVPLRADVEQNLVALQARIEGAYRATHAELARFKTWQLGFGAIALVLVGVAFWMGRSISRRLRAVAVASDRVAAGDVGVTSPATGHDEVAVVGRAVNAMAASLTQRLADAEAARTKVDTALDQIAGVVQRLATAATETLAASAQQAAAAQQQSTSVAEIVATGEEISATAEQATQRTRQAADASKRTEAASLAGRTSVERSVAAITEIKDQMSSLADTILALAERSQSIGDITTTINDFAEQSHVLALNAAIEATRAGEYGRGFAVVAVEVKALADQSKKATADVRRILGEIQKSTHSAVMLAEEGTKRAAAASRVIDEAGQALVTLDDQIGEGSRVAAQTVASAGQQAQGMSQISIALRLISEVANQSVAATRQTEQAAQSLNQLGVELKQILVTYGR